jgi:glycerophosphoryl diester phosphodiesterase
MTKILFILYVSFLITLPLSVDAQATVRSALPLISAHRGASRIAPENTRAAFVQAIEEGADFIEIDVRTSSDGHQVIIHDKSLQRTTGVNALVSDTEYSTISALSAGDWFAKEFSTEKIPTLEQICELLNAENKRRSADVMLYVDCKAINAPKVTSILKKYKLIDSAVFYGDEKTLIDIRKHFEGARIMPAFPGTKETDELIKKLKPYALDVPYDELDKKTVSWIQSKGVKVFSDLLGKDDHPDAYRKAIEYGIDLIQTDDVHAVRRIYDEFKTHDK